MLAAALPAAAGGADSVDLTNQGYQMLRLGAYGAAVDDLTEAIKLNPKAKYAYNDRGLAEMAMGDTDKAIADFDKAIEFYPKFQFAFFNRGLAKRAKGDMAGALADFDHALTIDDVVLDSALGGGWARSIVVSPTFPAQIYNNRGIVKIAMKDFAGAIEDFNKAIVIDPENARTYKGNIASAENGKGDLSSAIALNTGLIGDDPKNVNAYCNRAEAEREKGGFEKAVADYSHAIKLDRNFGPAYRGRGLSKMSLGDTEGGIVDFASTYSVLGEAQGLKGDPQGAIDSYTLAVKLYPDFLAAHGGGSKVQHSGTDFSTEVSVFAAAYLHRGLAERNNGDLNLARGDFSNAIKIEPSLAEAYAGRAQIERMHGDLVHAGADINRAIALDPANLASYLERCQLERETGDWAADIADCDHVMSVDDPLPGRTAKQIPFFGWEADGEYDFEYTAFPGADAALEKVKAEFGAGDAAAGVGLCDDQLSDFADFGPLLRARGLGNYLKGRWRAARYDLAKAVVEDTKKNLAGSSHGDHEFVTFDYAQIYFWIVRMHRGEGGDADKDLASYLAGRKNVGADEWPALLAGYLLGKASLEDLQKTAADGEPAKLRGRRCQIAFYSGVRRMFAGDPKAASADFHDSMATGAKGFFEYQLADAELQGLAHG
jgi:tetratricopeptide (TPR) repeat protein